MSANPNYFWRWISFFDTGGLTKWRKISVEQFPFVNDDLQYVGTSANDFTSEGLLATIDETGANKTSSGFQGNHCSITYLRSVWRYLEQESGWRTQAQNNIEGTRYYRADRVW